MSNWQLLLRIMSLGAALSSTKSISLAGFPHVVLLDYTSMPGSGTVNSQIVDFCLRRCRMAWPPHLMIGFACAGKFPSRRLVLAPVVCNFQRAICMERILPFTANERIGNEL